MSKKLHRCLSLVLVIMLLASLSLGGTLHASADNKTGDGLAAYAMNAYYEGWRYVWGGASYGAVDCSGLIYSYVGGGARVTEDMLYSSPESGYVSDGVPDIPGIGLWQPGHVGVYVGNGMAVDARDEISNVCYSAVSSKSWVMWFKVAGVTYGGDSSVTNNNQTTENTDSAAGSTDKSAVSAIFDTLSIGSQGSDVNALQERLKELGYFEDNTTEYFGTVTQAALIEFQTAAGLYADGVYTETVKLALFADDAPKKSVPEVIVPKEEADTESDDERSTKESEAAVAVLGDAVTTDKPNSDEDIAESDESESYAEEDYSDSDVSSDSEVLYEVGDVDEEITNIQYILVLLGYYDYGLTSSYDDNTAYAVAQYQLDHNLDATGTVDEDTLAALYRTFNGEDEQDTDTQTDENSYEDETDEEETNEDAEQSVTDEEYFGEEEKTVPAALSQSAEEDSESAEASAEESSDNDTESASSETESTDNSGIESVTVTTLSNTESSESSNISGSAGSSSDADKPSAESSVQPTGSSSGSDYAADVPKTGVITLYPKIFAAVGIVISLLIIFFAANVHYWNVSMEKRRQRARKAVSVSSYRRGSM